MCPQGLWFEDSDWGLQGPGCQEGSGVLCRLLASMCCQDLQSPRWRTGSPGHLSGGASSDRLPGMTCPWCFVLDPNPPAGAWSRKEAECRRPSAGVLLSFPFFFSGCLPTPNPPVLPWSCSAALQHQAVPSCDSDTDWLRGCLLYF